jgi:hypothetical protein
LEHRLNLQHRLRIVLPLNNPSIRDWVGAVAAAADLALIFAEIWMSAPNRAEVAVGSNFFYRDSLCYRIVD